MSQTAAMTRTPLIRHPNTLSTITRVEVEMSRPAPQVLSLRYVVADLQSTLVVPAPASGERRDNLWQRTCFEAFICIPGGDAYYELNLSPSTQWAAYRFDSFREGMANAEGVIAPQIEWLATDDGFELRTLTDLSGLAGLPADAPWRLGLTAVIEDGPDQLSYWALTHPPGVQDFHNDAGWTAQV
jgi:hypothetical protein